MDNEQVYKHVKRNDHYLYTEICAFASTFGKGDYTETIDLATRAQVEKFCMSLAANGMTAAGQRLTPNEATE